MMLDDCYMCRGVLDAVKLHQKHRNLVDAPLNPRLVNIVSCDPKISQSEPIDPGMTMIGEQSKVCVAGRKKMDIIRSQSGSATK